MIIICGGQTGADRAALDAAIRLGLPYGGWVPKGGWAEDFPYPPGLLSKYPNMREADTPHPAERTQLNVRDSDVTLILITEPGGPASRGTNLTEETARKLGRPSLIIRVDQPDAATLVGDWLLGLGGASILNIAGPRESEAPGIYALSRGLLETVLASFVGRSTGPRDGGRQVRHDEEAGARPIPGSAHPEGRRSFRRSRRSTPTICSGVWRWWREAPPK